MYNTQLLKYNSWCFRGHPIIGYLLNGIHLMDVKKSKHLTCENPPAAILYYSKNCVSNKLGEERI